VTFDLTAANNCNETAQYYTGTDTVQVGRIIAADVVLTG